MKKRTLLIFGILIFLYSLNGVTIFSSPEIYTPDISETFTVSIEIDEAIDFRGYKTVIHYDYSLLTFESASKGALLIGQNVGWWLVDSNTPGIIDAECIIFGAGEYTTGPGNILNLSFTSNCIGVDNLSFSEVVLYDIWGGTIPDVESENFYVIIGNNPAFAIGKCYLEGSYQNGEMLNGLNQTIPLSSPYPQDSITVNCMPADVVDWLLIELRETSSGSAIEFQSMFLYKDGAIKSVGLPCMIFMNISAENYFTVIHHRNHLAIMSSTAIHYVNEGEPNYYDFTNESQVYGDGGIVELERGVFGMIAGDANQDGDINPIDNSEYWRVQAGKNGYLSSDFNLDGNVFPDDRNSIWLKNLNMSSQVPNSIDIGSYEIIKEENHFKMIIIYE